MKQLLLSVFIFTTLFCGAQDTLYKVNSKPFINQKSILYTPVVQKTKPYVYKQEAKASDQNFWKLFVRQEAFRYSNKSVQSFANTLMKDNLNMTYAPFNFSIAKPLVMNPNIYYPAVLALDILFRNTSFMHIKFR